MNSHPPLQLPVEFLQVLESHLTFREQSRCHSRSGYSNFCFLHRSFPPSTKATFTTHLSLIQILLSPLISLHAECSTLARIQLNHNPRRKSPPSSPQPQSRPSAIDLELAFRGPSRDAFAWLSVFLASESSWAHPSPHACPACLTLQSFTGEPYLRMLVAASRLSPHFSEHGGSLIPSLELVSSSLQSAVAEDDFWGPRGWEEISNRAREFESGIIRLLAQRKELGAKYHSLKRESPRDATVGPEDTFAPGADFFSVSGPAELMASQHEKNVSVSTIGLGVEESLLALCTATS